MKNKLQEVLDWAGEQLRSSPGLPPWEWYELMKLREALHKIIKGQNAVICIAEENGVATIVRENDISLPFGGGSDEG